MNPSDLSKPTEKAIAKNSFERLAKERAAIPDERVKTVNLDVGSAVSVVLAVVARLQGLREEIVKKLLDFNITRFDELEDRALALQFANSDYVLAIKPSDHIKEQYAPLPKKKSRTPFNYLFVYSAAPQLVSSVPSNSL